MKQTLDRVSPYLPWVALLLLAGGAISYFITRRWDTTTNGLLLAGVLILSLFVMVRPDDVRRLMSGRQARYGSSTILSILFFTAIAVLLYYITYQNSDWRYDATETNEFTPLPETITLLNSLEKPVHVIGFFSFQATFQQEQANKLLDSLKVYTPNLTYEFVDPNQNPILAQQYEITSEGRLVFTTGEGEAEVFAVSPSLSDTDIHASLLKIINPVTKKVYFLTGQGQRDIEDVAGTGISNLKEFLEEAGFTVATLNLFTEGVVPADATAVALIDQQAPLTPAEVFALRDYLTQGGAAFIARDVLDEVRAVAEGDDINTFLLEDWGISLRNDIVIEPVYVQAGQQLAFLAAEYGNSNITTDLDQFGLAFNIARSLDSQAVEGTTKVSLALTSEEAWGETDFEQLATQGSIAPDPEDATGPLNVVVSAEKTGGARLIVVGDADFISNEMILLGGNRLFATNAFNWLANDEVSVNLTPRETVNRQVVVSQDQLGLLVVLSICFGPAIMGVAGVAVWYSRRQRK